MIKNLLSQLKKLWQKRHREVKAVGSACRIIGQTNIRKPRVIFIGASKTGLQCLKMMNDSPLYNVVGTVTAPKTFTISYRPEGVTNVLFADIKKYCEGNDIDCMVIKQGMKDSNLFEQVKAMAPDIFIVVGWYHLIPKSWLDLAPTYGLHASLLPDYTGGAPLVWAIINGEKKTGVTLFQFDNGVDSGPIVGQLTTDIYAKDTIATLYARIESLGVKLIKEHLPKIINGSEKLIVQDESKRRVFPQRKPEDGIIDWTLPANKIYDFVRAQTKPYPGAFTWCGKDKVTLWSCQIFKEAINPVLSPADVIIDSHRVFVGCGGGSKIEVTDTAINGVDTVLYDWLQKPIKPRTHNRFSINPKS